MTTSSGGAPQIKLARTGVFERFAPWLVGVGSSIAYFFLAGRLLISPGVRLLFSSAVTISAIGMGFLLTANSFLVAVDDSWIIQRAREAGAYKLLIRYLVSATKWCLCAAVASAIGLLFDPIWNLPWYKHALAIWVLIVTGTLAAIGRVLLIFSQILLALGDGED